MKERPILFSAPMVRAILDGSKTQTRRIIKLPTVVAPRGDWAASTVGGSGITDSKGHVVPEQGCIWHTHTGTAITYNSQPGDRLWVRETFLHEPADYCWEASVSIPVRPAHTSYRADCSGESTGVGWKPSIHMPRHLSRIDLEITCVRVERLQDISEADAIAEGIEGCDVVINGRSQGKTWRDYTLKCDDPCEWFSSSIDSYRTLWESINGPESWNANPWVWIVEFRRIDALKRAA